MSSVAEISRRCSFVESCVMSSWVRSSVIAGAGASFAGLSWGHDASSPEGLVDCSSEATVGAEGRCSSESWLTLRGADRRILYAVTNSGGTATASMLTAGYLDESI